MINKNIKNYAYFFENLKLSNLKDLSHLLDDNIYFEDPFNKTYGKNNFIQIFKNSLINLNEIKFKILAITSNNYLFFIKWEMSFFAFKRRSKIIGISEVRINKKGKIQSHIDYWDSFNNFYLRIPILGKIFYFVFKIIKSKI